MAAPESDATEVLRREILADARGRSAEIVGQARREAEARLARVRSEAEAERQGRLAQARADAARRGEALLASVAVEAGRLRSARLEALLQDLHDEAQRRLVSREGYDYAAALVALTTEAVRRMGGEAVVVRLAPADRAAVGERLAHVTLVEDASVTGGGVVVLDASGRRLWDNRLPARLDRLWPELRRQIVARLGGAP